MFCFIYKWMISLAADNGKPSSLPRWVSRHISRCSSCQSYAHTVELLEERLPADARVIAGQTAHDFDTLPYRIHTALDAQRGSSLQPPRPRRFLIPALGTAAALLFIVGGIFFISQPGDRPVLNQPEAPGLFAALSAGNLPPASLQGLVSKAESPLDSELHLLVDNVTSAGEYILTGLTPNLNPGSGNQRNTP